MIFLHIMINNMMLYKYSNQLIQVFPCKDMQGTAIHTIWEISILFNQRSLLLQIIRIDWSGLFRISLHNWIYWCNWRAVKSTFWLRRAHLSNLNWWHAFAIILMSPKHGIFSPFYCPWAIIKLFPKLSSI